MRKLFDAIDTILERYAESETNVARSSLGVGASRRRAGDGHEVSERTNRPISIQTQIRDIGAGIGEMWRIREIEYLRSKLDVYSFGDTENFPEHQVRICQAGSAHRVAGAGPECELRRCCECRLVEPLGHGAIRGIVGITDPVRALCAIPQVGVGIRRLRDCDPIS